MAIFLILAGPAIPDSRATSDPAIINISPPAIAAGFPDDLHMNIDQAAHCRKKIAGKKAPAHPVGPSRTSRKNPWFFLCLPAQSCVPVQPVKKIRNYLFTREIPVHRMHNTVFPGLVSCSCQENLYCIRQ